MASTGTQQFTGDDNTDIDTLGWTTDGGDFQVQSNRCQSMDAAWNRARYTDTQLDSADHYAQTECYDPTGMSVTCRQVGNTHTNYTGRWKGTFDATGAIIYKVVEGTPTELDNGATGTVNPSTVKLTIDGASQSLEVEGSEVASDTNADVTTGQYCGVSRSQGGICDDWIAEDLAAPAAGPSPADREQGGGSRGGGDPGGGPGINSWIIGCTGMKFIGSLIISPYLNRREWLKGLIPWNFNWIRKDK